MTDIMYKEVEKIRKAAIPNEPITRVIDAEVDGKKGKFVLVRVDRGDQYSTSYSYDEDFNLLTEKSDDGSLREYFYDCGKLIMIAENGGEAYKTLSYDNKGRLIEEKYYGNQVYRYEYSHNNMLVRSLFNNNELCKQWFFDIYGNMTDCFRYSNAGQNIEHFTKDIYNANGNILYRYDSDTIPINYIYDENGNLLEKTDSNGNKICEYVRDAEGRLLEINYNASHSPFVKCKYDNSKRISEMQHEDGIVEIFRYNKNDGKIRTYRKIVPQFGLVIVNKYDAYGKIVITDQYKNDGTKVLHEKHKYEFIELSK